jgi:alpha-D-xyloside xylohydrolase
MTYLRRLHLLICFVLPICAFANTPYSYQRMEDGVIIYPDALYAGNTAALRLQVITPNVIRVIASPQKSFPQGNSLMVTYKTAANLPEWKLQEADDKQKITVKTEEITAVADLQTGTVVFYDGSGRQILAEKKMGRKFEAAVSEGQRTYQVKQQFETAANDGWYGLGQHQDGIVNYKGSQVFLFQNNTEVAVPFLVSSKNYGILWDNNSISFAGDLRPFRELSSLKLFSKTGEPGWLTASYYNNKADLTQPVLQKAESSIQYEFLNDSKLMLPAEFKPANGSVIWEGSIASDLTGLHKLKVSYAGYIKIWLDGQLMLDRWRMAWNPCIAFIGANLTAGRKVAIKIEWQPDGTESYTSLKWLEPAEGNQVNEPGFSSEAGQQLDYYFIKGDNIDSVISGYRTLTGKAKILPSWTFGLWQSRERYKTQEEIISTVQEFRKRKIGLDNIVLDWSYWKENAWGSQEFESKRFPSPDSMIRLLHDQYNTRFTISVWPKFYEGIEAYNQFDKKGWLYRRNIADRQKDWIAQGYVSTFYDAFNPEAQKGFWKLLHDKLYKKGVDGWWMDASEPDILSNVSPQKRKEQMSPLAIGLTAEYVNAYPLENAKGIYEGQRATDPDKRVFILTRSAFPGLQRYAAATWSGDISSRWHDMKLQIAAGINFSLSGLPYWSMDVGGFAVEKRFEKPDEEALEEWREMNTRWYQFGAFVPLFRVHGQFPFREIYNVAPETHPAYKSMLYYNKLRYRLLPYIYSMAGNVYLNNYTMLRGLVMDFANDSIASNLNDQYMFGPSLLINPVTTYHATERNVYLPAGQGWYDLYSGKYFKGNQTIIAGAPYERSPVFVKEGSIIPFGPELQYTSEKKADTISLYVYTGKDATFTIYEDENTNYNYEKGAYATIKVAYTEKQKRLTIQDRSGSFPGMLKERVFKITWITPSKSLSLDFNRKKEKLIRYNGNAISVDYK